MNEREIRALVKDTVKECREFFRQQGWCSAIWDVKVQMSFSGRRKASYGGVRRGSPFISLVLHPYVNKHNANFYEYRSFQHDDEIGNIEGNTQKAVRALVVHEMSHALQYSGAKDVIAASMNISSEVSVRGHGVFWKSIYRAARNALVNDDTTKAIKKPAKIVSAPAHTMKRSAALAFIRDLKNQRWTNREIISCLVRHHYFKKTTATTYTYSVK